jgi:hypothetical protein
VRHFYTKYTGCDDRRIAGTTWRHYWLNNSLLWSITAIQHYTRQWCYILHMDIACWLEWYIYNDEHHCDAWCYRREYHCLGQQRLRYVPDIVTSGDHNKHT